MAKPHKHFILKSEKKKLPMAKPRSRCICYVAAVASVAVAATSISKAAAAATTASPVARGNGHLSSRSSRRRK